MPPQSAAPTGFRGQLPGSAPVRIETTFGLVLRQNRWTVALRYLLALPHVVCLVAISIGALGVVMAAWIVALVSGRLPGSLERYLGGYLRYSTRLSAYLYLLTDQYPPFAFSPGGYPVDVRWQLGPLNRLAVLFRLILMIPASIVSGLLGAGTALVAVFIWVIVLLAGRMPLVVFEALVATLRFQARCTGYGLMLTSAYPDGLFGDQPVAPAIDPPSGTPRFSLGHLMISKHAKWLISGLLALGAIYEVGYDVVTVNAVRTITTNPTLTDFVVSYNVLQYELTRDQAALNACNRSGGTGCVTNAAENAEQEFATFNTSLTGYAFPSNARSEVNELSSTSKTLTLLFHSIQEGQASVSSLEGEITNEEAQLRSDALALIAQLS
jgi:hypothetical protein